jgi:transcriptional regulator with XRE-family HTH domain
MREDTIRSAALIREARLRAGFSQEEMAAAVGKDRSVITRWERGLVAPSLDTLIALVRACGFDIPLQLVVYDPEPDQRVAEVQMLSPERRVDRFLERRAEERGR